MQNSKNLSLIGLLVLVLAVRLGFLGLFHHQLFSGPSTQFEQAFVAMNLVDGKGIKIFQEFPLTLTIQMFYEVMQKLAESGRAQ